MTPGAVGDMAEPGPSQLWHHRIHQRWAGEDLYFLRLAFFPRYRREKVVNLILEVMTEEEIQSFTIYEALGLFDLFIRAWLPSHATEKLKQKLNAELKVESLQLLESFSVAQVLRHHVWETDGSVDTDPSESLLKGGWEDAQIARINSGDLNGDEQERLFEERVVAPLRPCEGVKFFTVITPATFSVTQIAHEALEEGLLELLDNSSIKEPSLYAGSGFGEYIVMGRAEPGDFFAITELSTEINRLGVSNTISARPYTHVCAQPEPLFYADVLPLKDMERMYDIAALLQRHESDTFEVKGSLSLDLGRWLSTNEVDPVSTDKVANDGVIKAIVGMLNADGGQIVVGALEASDEFKGVKAADHPKLAGLPIRGDYICVGIDAELGEKGWDGFRLRLHQLMSARIQPSPAGQVSVSRETIEGRQMCVIGVQPTRANWFYRVLGDSGAVNFYVRDGNRTVSYSGVEADTYKAGRPRG